MAPTVTIGGVSVPIPLFLGKHTWTSVATGSVGSGTAIVDDPTGVYDFLELSQVVAEESDCSLKRTFTGYAYNITTSRGPYSTGAGRIHTMTIGDLNFLLHLYPLYGAGAIRPRESGSARLAWLMTTPGMAGIVFDNGLITSNAAMFGPEDYRQRYHDEVLQSICVAGIGARIFYLTWVETAAAGEEITLFYSEPPSVLMSSTLGISNIRANANESTVFAPWMDAELEQQGEEIYCGLWLTYSLGGHKLFTHNATTHATYFASSEPPGLHRIGTLTLDRVGELDTAQHHSNVWLNVHSGALQTVSLTMQLPSSKVNLINAGMLVDTELSHLMGYETGLVPRVNERTVSLTPDRNGLYDLALKLSINGAPIAGGGGGTPTPFEPNCDLGFVQYALNVGTSVGAIDLPAAPTVGNTLIYVFAGRTTSVGSFPPATGTWTLIGEVDQGIAGAATCGLYYKTVETGDAAHWVTALATSDRALMAEFSGAMTFDVPASRLVPPLDENTISITPTAGKKALLVAAVTNNMNMGGITALAFNPVSGMSLVYPSTGLFVQGPPSIGFDFQVVDNTSGSYTVGFTGAAWPYENQNLVAAAFTCDASAEPPDPGQEVPGEFVAFGDGSTMAFTTAFPYAPGSLKVWVDGHPILLGLTETDPTTGAFTLDFAPKAAEGDSPAERVTATYQATAQPIQARSTLTSANTKTDFLTKVADLSIDVIELASGDYDWQNVVITTDRTTAPLIVRPALGATVNFVGPATTTGIIFQFGSSASLKAKWITFDGNDAAGGGAMVFKDFALAQSGVFEPRSSDHCSFVNLTFTNLARTPDPPVTGSAPPKSWCFYISGQGGGNNDHLLIDSCHLLAPAVNRDMSGIQIDSSGSHGQIQISNIDMAEYHLAFYCARPVTNLVLSDWTLDDCGRAAGPWSIRITGAVSIAGLYQNIVATSSDPLSDNHSGGGVFVNGGGNSGI